MLIGLTNSIHVTFLFRFNIDDDMMSSSDFGGARTSQSSASESTGRADSLEGSPIPISSDTRRSRLRSSSSQLQSLGNNKKGIISPQSQTKNFPNSPSEKPLKDDKSSDVFSITTVSSPRNARKDIKPGKRSQGLSQQQRQGRDQGVSASARRIFSSLRKTGRGRSSSRERTEKASPTKIGNEAKVHDDLSSDANLPGILKIFGDAVSPGAKYKSVLATRQSKARELVKAALERYGIPRSMARKFVLCEVVGRIREENAEASTAKPVEETFVEDYVRPLNDHEKPLILQSYWKPLEGYARRFELRDRSQVGNAYLIGSTCKLVHPMSTLKHRHQPLYRDKLPPQCLFMALAINYTYLFGETMLYTFFWVCCGYNSITNASICHKPSCHYGLAMIDCSS